LYLPSFVSFRVTDIWRSFIAQRCLWELGYGTAFHAPESVQRRNMHNLMRDFEEEIPGYLNNNRIVSILEKLQLAGGPEAVDHNMYDCYEALISSNLIPAEELPLLEAWIQDMQDVHKNTVTL
jgi:STELLO glycosyltransferases